MWQNWLISCILSNPIGRWWKICTKKYIHSTSRKDCSRCAGFIGICRILHLSTRIASSQFSKKSRVWSSFKMMYWYMEQQRSNTRRKCLRSKMNNMKRISPLMKCNYKKDSSVSFLGYLVSKEGIAHSIKHETVSVFCRLSEVLRRNDTRFW